MWHSGTVLWRQHRQFITSNTWNMVLRIFKMIATSGFLTDLECTKLVFGRGFAPDPAGEAYSAPDSIAGLRGRGEKGEGKREGKGGEGKGRKWERPPPLRKFLDPPLKLTYHRAGHFKEFIYYCTACFPLPNAWFNIFSQKSCFYWYKINVTFNRPHFILQLQKSTQSCCRFCVQNCVLQSRVVCFRFYSAWVFFRWVVFWVFSHDNVLATIFARA